MTEMGYGPDPMFASYEPLMAKKRKLHDGFGEAKIPVIQKQENLEVENSHMLQSFAFSYFTFFVRYSSKSLNFGLSERRQDDK